MARRMKRSLSLLLALVMCLSLVNISAFAAGYEDQVMDGYFVVGSDGVTGTTENATNSDQGYTVSKTINQTGENAFDITLKVETQQTVQTNDAAVILVIDVSGSMQSCAECGGYSDNRGNYYHRDCEGHRDGSRVADEDSRMAATISAAKNFVQSLKENNSEGGSLYVSVVKFSTNAYKVCDWIDITEGNNISTVNRAIDRLEADGGTNLDAGLTLAYNRLGMNDVSSASNKYTVLLTDGEPTYYYSGNSTSTDKIEGSRGGGGSSASENTVNHAIDAANNVKSRSTLYTICFGVEDDVCLEGQTIHVCAHCEESRDKHVRVELCANCGQPKSDHPRGDWGIRWCPTGDWSSWDAETYYYCDETRETQYEDKTVTNGELTVGSFLSGSIATSSDHAYNAKNTAALNEAFKDIADSASEGNTGAGTQVIDPMGQYITFGQVKSVTGGTANFANNTLTWTLDPEDAQTSSKDGTTLYTYTLKYTITLDTAAEGFQETDADGNTKYYPTNGYTSLKVPGKNDVVFNVPGVCGTIPTVGYTIEYYKWDKQTGEYPDEPTKSRSDTAKVWTVVNAPAGYENEYDSDHYSYEKGDPATITVSVNPDNNVIRLYYKPDTATVTVNHYYREDVTDVNGVTTTGTYGTPTTDTFTAYVGDRYPASGEVALKTQNNTYTLVTSTDEAGHVSDSRYITSVSENSENNVINLYYVKHTDNRLEASVTLQENYETWEWKINDSTGRYELVKIDGEIGTPSTVAENIRIPANHTQNIADKTDYTVESITANGTAVSRDDDKNITFALNEGVNPIVVTYKKVIDNRGEQVDVTIEHYYTQHNYTSDGNGLKDNPDPDHALGDTVTVQRYVGETFDFVNDADSEGFKTEYQGATYTAMTTAPAAFKVTAEGAVVKIEYERSVYPNQTTFTVYNHFRTWTSVVDPETGEVSWTLSREDHTDPATYPLEGSGVTYYVGQTHTVPTNPQNRTGYTQDLMADVFGDVSDETITLGEGTNEAHVYFDKKDGEEATSASITVIHQYYQEVETVKDGVVTTEKRFEGDNTVKEYGPVGASYTITPVPEYNGNTYTRTDDNSLTASYNNGTVTLTYVRDGGSDLTTTDLTVTHNYFVKNMTVQNGVAGYYESPVSEGSSTDYVVKDKNGNVITDPSKLYVGMVVTVEQAPTYNGQTYTARTDNPATTLTLGESGTNSLELNYDRENPLAKVEVTVDHTYLEHVYTYEGGVESTQTNTTYGTQTKVDKYVGESYTAAPVPDGYTLTSAKDGETDIEPTDDAYVVTVGENGNSIHFVYEKDSGKRAPVTVTVYHYYTEIDWDGTVTGCGTIGYEAEVDAPVSSYAGLTYTATLKLKADENGENGYTLVDQNATPAFDEGLTITLQEGLNEIHLYYEKQIDSRDTTKVKVIHNYYARDNYTVDSTLSDADYIAQEGVTPEYRTEVVYDTVEDGVWVGNEYTATQYNIVYFKDETGAATIERVYELVNVTPEGGKIASLAAMEGEEIPNVIVINMIRDYSTDPGDVSYTVIHEYYTDGNRTGSTTSQNTGKVGGVVNAADIAKVTTYEGNTYTYTSADKESMTLTADAEDNVITLRYDRTTGGGYIPPTDPVDPPTEPTDPPTDPTDPPTEIEDEDPPLSDLPDDEGEIDISDEEPPLSDLPEETIDDEEPPMADAPETGDNLWLWITTASLSGLGLIALGVNQITTGRKKKDAESK